MGPKRMNERLTNREVPMEMTGDQFRAAGHRLGLVNGGFDPFAGQSPGRGQTGRTGPDNQDIKFVILGASMIFLACVCIAIWL